MAAALVVTVPLAVGLALLHGVYLRGREGARRRLGLVLHLLNGVPSILFGIFGFIVFVHGLGVGKSWLTGGVLLGLMILPTVAVALQQRIDGLPAGYLEAAAGLGLSRSQIVWSVVLPQCASGLVTGALLGLARAAGETAPILFTATVFSGPGVPHGVRESPVLSLPYHIFVLAQDSFAPAVAPRVWATALVLLALVLCLSLAALPLRLRLHEEARRG
jgi:phosphate transport system permease protein